MDGGVRDKRIMGWKDKIYKCVWSSGKECMELEVSVHVTR